MTKRLCWMNNVISLDFHEKLAPPPAARQSSVPNEPVEPNEPILFGEVLLRGLKEG